MEVRENNIDFQFIQKCESEIVSNNRINEIRDGLEDSYDVVSESTICSIENSVFNLRSSENSIEHFKRSTETIGHFGNIEIENSSNITFGNKTFFNGPVVIKSLVLDNDDLKSQRNVFEKVETVETFEKWKKHRLWLIFVSIFVASMIVATSITGYWLSVYGRQRSNDSSRFKILILSEGNEDSTTLLSELNTSPSYELPTSPPYELSTSIPHESFTSPLYELTKPPLHELFKNRSEWGALPPKHEFKQLNDVKLVIIAHTATPHCSDFANCAIILQSIQSYHMKYSRFDDIAYNFMVGGDGVVYEGRGYYQGAHTLHYNENSICISFIGDFNSAEASQQQLTAAQRIIEQGLQLSSINPQYILCGQLQLRVTESPGSMLYKQIMTLSHWSKDKCASNS